MKEKIGFIGLGAMGKPMASNLIRKNFPVVCYDIKDEPLQELAKLGGEVAHSSGEVGKKAKTIIIMTRTFPQVKEVVLGKDGVLGTVKKNSVIIIMSTISCPQMREIAEICKRKDVRIMDAPVSGGTKGAREGTLTIMVGGDKETFRTCLPLLKVIGKNVHYVGGIGMGQTVKSVIQLIVSVNLLAVAEGVVLGLKSGIELSTLSNIIESSAGESWVLKYVLPRIINRDFTSRKSTLATLIKDSGIVADAGMKLKVPLPISTLAHQIYRQAEAFGLAEDDISGIIKLFEKFANLSRQ